MPDTYTSVDFDNLPSLPSVEAFTSIARDSPSIVPHLAFESGDVGVTRCLTNGSCVVGFSLIFPLEKFDDPLRYNHVKNFDPAFLLGRITNPTGVGRVTELSLMKKNERDDIDFRLSFE